MTPKTRKISIKRTVTVLDDNNQEMKQKRWFVVNVNKAVPFDHRMLQ